jgi:RHS repeat-associated protein
MVTALQLSENTHQGFEGIKAALCLASMEAKSNDAPGMPVCLRQEGIRSCSSGKERDNETGLDYFGARYLSSAQGRWTSPDAPFADQHPANPQSWNLYAYVRNNPLRYVDPSGDECVYINNSGGGTIGGNDAASCISNGGYWVDGIFTSGIVYSEFVILFGYDPNTGKLTSSYPGEGTPAMNPNLFRYDLNKSIPKDELRSMIKSLNRSGMKDELVECIINHETKRKPGLVNPDSQATGLLQVLGSTAEFMATTYKKDFLSIRGSIFPMMKDPAINIVTGSDVLRSNGGKSGDVTRALKRQWGHPNPQVNANFAKEMRKCAGYPADPTLD